MFQLTVSWLLQKQDAEYEAEQKRIKKEKELEIARLRARQERARDYKADQVRNKSIDWLGISMSHDYTLK